MRIIEKEREGWEQRGREGEKKGEMVQVYFLSCMSTHHMQCVMISASMF